MTKHVTKLAFLGLCLGLLAAHAAGSAQGEIAEKAQTRSAAETKAEYPDSETQRRMRPEERRGGYRVLSDSLQIQCWQEGIKIIDERGLRAVDLRSLTRDRQPALRGKKGTIGEIMVVPLPDATCLVRPES